MSSCLSHRGWTALTVLGLIVAPTSLAFGQHTVSVTLLPSVSCVRSTGEPNTCNYTFPGVTGQAVLHVTNGNNDGALRTSAAIVTLNGQVVVSPAQFSQQVSEFELASAISEQNTLSVKMRGAPNSRLTLTVIQQVAAEAVAVVGSSGGTLQVTDPTSAIHGVKVEFPLDCVQQSTVFTIREEALAAPVNTSTLQVVPLMHFSIEPGNVKLLVPVKFTIPYSDDDADSIIDGTDIPVGFLSVSSQSLPGGPRIRREAYIDTDARALVGYTTHFSNWDSYARRWKRNATVLYYIESTPAPVAQADYYYDDVQNLTSQWSSAVSGLISFRRTYNQAEAEVVVRSASLGGAEWGDCRNAIACQTGWESGRVDVVANADRNDWAPGSALGVLQMSYLRVMLHEFGHVMGLPDYTSFNTSPDNVVVMWYDHPTATGPAELWWSWWYPMFPATELSEWDIREVRNYYGLPPSSGAQWLTFVGGNPGVPGDGLTVSPDWYGLYTLSSPWPLAEVTDGITLTTFPAPLQVAAYFIYLDNPAAPPACRVELGFGFGLLSHDGFVAVNGVQGSYVHVPQSTLQVFADIFNSSWRPGCNLQVKDWVITRLLPYVGTVPTSYPLPMLDALAVGKGQGSAAR